MIDSRFSHNPDHQRLADAVTKVTDKFDDAYWSRLDETATFPHEFHRAMAEGGWLGIAIPESCGGSGLGITEAAILMHGIASGGGGFAAASSVHLNIFGPHAIVVHGTPEQRDRFLPPLIRGDEKACFAVTEPDAGLDTTSIKTFAESVEGGYRIRGQKIWTSTAQVADKILILARTAAKDSDRDPTLGMSLFYTDLDRTAIEVRAIDKMGRAAVDSNAIFIDNLFVPSSDLIGEEGRGFRYLLDSLNPERILIAAEAIGLGRDALRRAVRYARERNVFGRPIGQNQGIQHPLAESWIQLESAWALCLRAAALYDAGQPCGAEANAAKFLGARAGFDTCTRSVMTHGGMGYAKEYQVERLFRESMIPRLAPVSEQLILSFIGEKVLGLPKSY